MTRLLTIGGLLISLTLNYVHPSYATSPHRSLNQLTTSAGEPTSNIAPQTDQLKSPAGNKKKAPKEGVKKPRSTPSKLQTQPPKSAIQPHQNPIDMSTGQELIPLPNGPKSRTEDLK